MSRSNLDQLESNAFMTLPTNYELITPEIAKMHGQADRGILAKAKGDSVWNPVEDYTLQFNDWACAHYDFAWPLGTTAMLTTEAPKAGECNCSFSYLRGSPAHEVNCPAHPRNAMILVLPGWLAGLKEKPEGLQVCYRHDKDKSAQWGDKGLTWPLSEIAWPRGDYMFDYAYTVPRWVLDEIEGREKTCTCGKDYNDAFEGGYMQHELSCPLLTQPESEVKTCPETTYHGHAVHAKLEAEREAHVAALVPSPEGIGTPMTNAMQRIKFEGCDCIVSAPENIEALETELSAAIARAEQAEKERDEQDTARKRWIQIAEDTSRQLAEAKARVEELEKSEARAIEFCVGLSLSDPADHPRKLLKASEKIAMLKWQEEQDKKTKMELAKQCDTLRAALTSAEAERAEVQRLFEESEGWKHKYADDVDQLRATVATLTAERDELNAKLDTICADPHYEGGVQYWIGLHNEMAILADKFEKERDELKKRSDLPKA